jgi:hypothetical protein
MIRKRELGEHMPVVRVARTEPHSVRGGDHPQSDPGTGHYQIANILRRRKGVVIGVVVAGILLAAVAAISAGVNGDAAADAPGSAKLRVWMACILTSPAQCGPGVARRTTVDSPRQRARPQTEV